jgi:competence protein ComFC
LSPLPSWHRAAQGFIDLLCPPRCAACGRMAGWFCPECQNGIEPVEPPFCPLCGRSTPAAELCKSCRVKPLEIDGIRSVGYLEGALQTAIHRFKYSNLRALAQPLGRLAAEYLARYDLPVDTLVPVPLHTSRLRQRGYNQAELLTREIAGLTGLDTACGSMRRVRSTVPQVGLTAIERRRNVSEAFECSPGGLGGKRILLVDDVCTTGATLEACSIALRAAGIKTVWGFTLARERWR